MPVGVKGAIEEERPHRKGHDDLSDVMGLGVDDEVAFCVSVEMQVFCKEEIKARRGGRKKTTTKNKCNTTTTQAK